MEQRWGVHWAVCWARGRSVWRDVCTRGNTAGVIINRPHSARVVRRHAQANIGPGACWHRDICLCRAAQPSQYRGATLACACTPRHRVPPPLRLSLQLACRLVQVWQLMSCREGPMPLLVMVWLARLLLLSVEKTLKLCSTHCTLFVCMYNCAL